MGQRTLMTVTDAAIQRIRQLMKARQDPALGIRIGVSTKGCSGLSYTIEYVDEIVPMDERVDVAEDVSIFIDPKAMLFILGMEMDFLEDKMQSGFAFNNPNEKGRCGCGKSFHV